MDSPPDKEKNNAFLAINDLLAAQNVLVPKIFKQDLTNGFFVIEDFGDKTLLPLLTETSNPEKLYNLCLDQLNKIQSYGISNTSKINNDYIIPHFDQKLLSYELELFREWFITRYLGVKLTDKEHDLLDRVFAELILKAREQPQILVHRDYHSRNLILLDNMQIGVIDFQDAVWGPLTYDLVSLYRDCYIAWPFAKVHDWVLDYFNKSKQCQLVSSDIDFQQYWHWFLYMTLQRNFKTIGIFSRLFIRDNKPGYLNDIPRTFNYALETTRYLLAHNKTDLLNELDFMLNEKIFPVLNKKND